MGAYQPFGARAVGLGKFEIGDAAGAFRDQPVDFRLKWPRVDLEQQLTLLHARAVREGHAVDEAVDARVDFHGVGGLQAAREFLPFAQRPVNHLGHRHLRQGSVGGGLGLCAGVSGAGKQHNGGERGDAEENRQRRLTRDDLLQRHVWLRSEFAKTGRFRVASTDRDRPCSPF